MKNILLSLLNSDVNCNQHRVMHLNLEVRSEVTFVIPVFNQEKYIASHLNSLLNYAELHHDIIIINDASTDQTHQEINNFLETLAVVSKENLRKTNTIRYFKNIWPWYETRCDDFAFRLSSTKYIIEIQADIKVREKGFDKKMLEVMEREPNLIAISGRGTHRLEKRQSQECSNINANELAIEVQNAHGNLMRKLVNFFGINHNKDSNMHQKKLHTSSAISFFDVKEIFPTSEVFVKCGRAGFLGELVDLIPYEGKNAISSKIGVYSDKLWRGETVMRGPLIISKALYLKMGGFDVNSFFLGNDDHDLFYRARQKGLQTAYMPIFFSSPLSMGNTRKKKSASSKFFHTVHKYVRIRNLRKTSFHRLIS
jgi:GT2 family glycosyltransferase